MTTSRRRWRSTIPVRLTLLYISVFFLAGAVLVTLMYLYRGRSSTTRWRPPVPFNT